MSVANTISIRVYDEVDEVSKVVLDNATVYREGIITDSGLTSLYLDFTTSTVTIAVDTACTDLLLWSEDEQEDGSEFRILTMQYAGVGVDGDGDGAGTLSTSAEKSVNVCSMIVYDGSDSFLAVANGSTTITTTAGHLNGNYVYLPHQIITRKLCQLIPLLPVAGNLYICVMKNIDNKRIHWHILKRS